MWPGTAGAGFQASPPRGARASGAAGVGDRDASVAKGTIKRTRHQVLGIQRVEVAVTAPANGVVEYR